MNLIPCHEACAKLPSLPRAIRNGRRVRKEVTCSTAQWEMPFPEGIPHKEALSAKVRQARKSAKSAESRKVNSRKKQRKCNLPQEKSSYEESALSEALPAKKDAIAKRARTHWPGEAAVVSIDSQNLEGLGPDALQYLDRRTRSLNNNASTTGTAPYLATELIFRLERRGEGWGEEILPHISIERRPLTSVTGPSRKNRGNRPDPWEDGSPEWFLKDSCGIPGDRVDAVMNTATAWRVTPGGRPLIDRRRRSRVARNVVCVTEYLQDLGVPAGAEGVGAILMQVPQLMLCKPSTNDRWDRRAVELACFAYQHGHCNVPEGESISLGAWVRKQRALWQQASLSQDRMQILSALGFELGSETEITEEWEYRFDYLVECLIQVRAKELDVEGWKPLAWGQLLGMMGRESCLWTALQRRLKESGLLRPAAMTRLEAMGFPWELQNLSEADQAWMHQLGCLIFCTERAIKLNDLEASSGLASPLHGAVSESSPRDSPIKPSQDPQILAQAKEEVRLQLEGQMSDQEIAWLEQTVCKRMQALETAPLTPGLGFWLARQQQLWRKMELDPESAKLLRLAGVSLGTTSLDMWRQQAHEAAAYLLGSRLGQNLYEGSLTNGSTRLKSSQRMRVARWVESQQALHAEGRLSRSQLRYLTMLELSWLVLGETEAIICPTSELLLEPEDSGSCFVLQQHLALAKLGWLPEQHVIQLKPLIQKQTSFRTEEDLEWDQRLCELLAHRRQYGSLRLSDQSWEKQPGLQAWLGAQCRNWAAQLLPMRRQTQLVAMGVERPVTRYSAPAASRRSALV